MWETLKDAGTFKDFSQELCNEEPASTLNNLGVLISSVCLLTDC